MERKSEMKIKLNLKVTEEQILYTNYESQVYFLTAYGYLSQLVRQNFHLLF